MPESLKKLGQHGHNEPAHCFVNMRDSGQTLELEQQAEQTAPQTWECFPSKTHQKQQRLSAPKPSKLTPSVLVDSIAFRPKPELFRATERLQHSYWPHSKCHGIKHHSGRGCPRPSHAGG